MPHTACLSTSSVCAEGEDELRLAAWIFSVTGDPQSGAAAVAGTVNVAGRVLERFC